MRILKKEKIAPIHVMPGDTIVLTYDDGYGNKTEVLSLSLRRGKLRVGQRDSQGRLVPLRSSVRR